MKEEVLKQLTIKGAKELLERREIGPEELHGQYLKLIEEENDKWHAFLKVEEFVEQGQADGLMAGVPLAIKDNISMEGTITTAGSKILKNYVAVYDATVIKKLKEAGATFLGKTNLDEFAMGSSTENSAWGVTKNPHDRSRVSGGSSGGSAAAVAAGLCVAALGSDTGGSVRQPAAFCGIVGLKPTYGRVSRYGLLALASSLDQIGPLTKNVYDAALLMQILSGWDKMDSTTMRRPEVDFTANLTEPLHGLKVAMPREYFDEGLDGEVNKVVERAIGKLEKLGAHVDQVSLPHTAYSLAAYYIIMPAEASSNLARYDGIRYGFSKRGADLLDTYLQSRSEGLGDEPRRRIILGTYTLSSGYYEAYYSKAQKVRTLIARDFEEVFDKFDVVVGPTTPTTAFKIGEKADPLSMYLSDIYTVPVNLAGLPALSLPCGEVNGLPVGLQIIGKKFAEEKILQVGYNLEQELRLIWAGEKKFKV